MGKIRFCEWNPGASYTVPPPLGLNQIWHFWQKDLVSNPATNELMIKQNGNDWFKRLARYMAESSGKADSKLWLTESEQNELFNDRDRRVYIIHSTKEIAFDPSHCVHNLFSPEYLSTHNYTVHGAEHFEYWNKKYWEQTSRCIRAAIAVGFCELTSKYERSTMAAAGSNTGQQSKL
jgi:hypothetical protein